MIDNIKNEDAWAQNAVLEITNVHVIPNEEYRKHDAVNQSFLKDVLDQAVTNAREALARRVNALSEDAVELLKLAAVVGYEFDYPTLAVVSEQPEERGALPPAFI